MTDILVQFVLPILTAFLSYLAATYQSRTQLKSVQEQHKTEMAKIEAQQKAELAKLEKEMDKQAELHEKNAQTDIVKDFMGSMLDTPEMKQMAYNAVMDEFKKAK